MQKIDFLPLDTSSRLVCGELEWLRQLAKDNESKRNDQMLAFELAIKEVSQEELDLDYAYELKESLIDDAQQYDLVYLHAQRTGLIFTVYAIVEAYLNRECKFCCDHFLCPLKLKEVRGTGLHRSHLYLKKVVQCNCNIFEAEFTNMFVLGRLRNILVHANGQVMDKGDIKNFQSYAQRHGTPFQITADGKVVLTTGFANHFIDMSEALVTAVGQAPIARGNQPST